GAEKQDVIKTGPDVPYAFIEVVEKRAEPADRAALDAPCLPARTENSCVGLAIRLQPHQPAMLKIKIEEKIVADLKNFRRPGAVCVEPQHLIGAVTVVIDQMLDYVRGTGVAVRLQCQAGQQIGSDRCLQAAQLAPGDDAVIVDVEAERIVEVTQRDVPLPG